MARATKLKCDCPALQGKVRLRRSFGGFELARQTGDALAETVGMGGDAARGL